MALQLSPAASWGLVLLLILAVVQTVLVVQRRDLRRWERHEKQLDDAIAESHQAWPGRPPRATWSDD
jgi:Flp pilus assembly protein TadB